MCDCSRRCPILLYLMTASFKEHLPVNDSTMHSDALSPTSLNDHVLFRPAFSHAQKKTKVE